MTAMTQSASAVLERFLLGFEGTSLPAELRAKLARGLAGVAIYPRNFASVDSLRVLTREIRAAAGRAVLIGIDQEGGTKFSLPEPFTQWPCPADLGKLGEAALVEGMARAMGEELRAVGVNLNFAPMLDLHVNPASPVTQQRSFGADPRTVGALGAAVARGLRAVGVLACAKHFPGHGDVQVDPHHELPVYDGTAARLASVDTAPYAEVIAAGVPAIMSAHIHLPKIDPLQPASLSRVLIYATLRRKLRFDGLVLADDLGMGAIRKRCTVGEAAIEAIRADSDIIMLCHDWSLVEPCIEMVGKALAVGMLEPAEWEGSQKRIARARALTEEGIPPAPALDVIGCEAHRKLAAEIREKIARATDG